MFGDGLEVRPRSVLSRHGFRRREDFLCVENLVVAFEQLRDAGPVQGELQLLREVRRMTRVVGVFPDGYAALMLVSARLRQVSGTKWGTHKYMNMQLLNELA